MKHILLTSFIVFSAISCQKKTEEISKQKTSPLDSALAAPEAYDQGSTDNCYMSVKAKDTVFMSINDNLGTLTGKMRYKNFEKDSSYGDLVGSKNGDTLQLTYTFQAEGMTSEREIYFLQKNGKLLEGIGEQKVEGDKSLYADKKSIKYSEDNTLETTDCKGFEKHFVIEKPKAVN